MIDAYDIYNEVLGLVNKEESGYLTAELFNRYCRSANRYYTEIPKWCCLHGFRVVCEVQ